MTDPARRLDPDTAPPLVHDGDSPLADGLQAAPGVPLPTPARLLSDAAAPTFPVNLPALLREVENLYLAAALAQSHGNRKAAADLLGLRRTTLVEKLRRRTRETVVT